MNLLREARACEDSHRFDGAKSRQERTLAAALWALSMNGNYTEEAGGAEGSTWAALFYRPRRPVSYVLWITSRGRAVAEGFPSRLVLPIWQEIARDLDYAEGEEEEYGE
jgi:hypothetical protein